MTQSHINRALVPAAGHRLNPSAKQLVIGHAEATGGDAVVHLSPEEVRLLADSTRKERDRLLVIFLFDSCLRVSEALALTPSDISTRAGGFVVRVRHGKGGRYGLSAISPSLAALLRAYAYENGLGKEERFFPFSGPRAFQIVAEAFARSGIARPSRAVDKIGTVHILRHSGAIERLRQTRNPIAVRDQLRHRSMAMTMRYFKTLSQEESLAIQEGVDFRW